MNRLFSCSVLLGLAFSISFASGAEAKSHLPNIILCMADDLGWGDVGYNGHPHIKTPHLDAMAKAGARLDRFYVGSPLCVPSRAGFLTGRTAVRCGISNHRDTVVSHLRDEEITIAELCRTKGYRTGHFGKWHLGMLTADYRGDKTVLMTPGMQGFDEWFASPSSVSTFDPYMDPGGIGRALGRKDRDMPTPIDLRAGYIHNGKPLAEPLEGCAAEIVMDRAIPFIREAVKSGKPVLATIWFNPPHSPVVGHPGYMAEHYAHLPEPQQHYYSLATAIDAQMGRLRKELESLGIAGNTMLTFTSDNGPGPPIGRDRKPDARLQGSAGPFRERKASLYEGGIREPGLAVWPGTIPPGTVIESPCTTLDYFPTIAHLIGAELPDRPYDGIDIMHLLSGTETKARRSLGFLFRDAVAWSGETHKLIAGEQTKGKRAGGAVDLKGMKFELFDLTADPGETNDLAEKQPKRVAAMKKELKQWVTSVDQSRLGADYQATGIPEGSNVRIIPLAQPLQSDDGFARWMYPDEYTAQDILEMIDELKPQVLERFITGRQKRKALLPVREGCPPMTVVEFLNAAQAAGAPGCIIIPKLNLTWISWGKEKYFWEAAENNFRLPLERPIRIVNLDNWPAFLEKHGEQKARDLLQRLREIGYLDIGVNMAGGFHAGFGHLSFADFLINAKDWSIRLSQLEKMKADPDIRQYYLYIDYPGQMEEFMKLSPDRQADVLTKVIQPAEKREGFTFVYPVLFDDWDATKHITPADGPYRGASIFDVIRNSIRPD